MIILTKDIKLLLALFQQMDIDNYHPVHPRSRMDLTTAIQELRGRLKAEMRSNKKRV